MRGKPGAKLKRDSTGGHTGGRAELRAANKTHPELGNKEGEQHVLLMSYGTWFTGPPKI